MSSRKISLISFMRHPPVDVRNTLCNYPRYRVIVKDAAVERAELREELDRNERLDRFEDLVCFLNFNAAPYRQENRAEIITRPLVMLQLRRWRGGSRRGKLAARLIMPSLPRLSFEPVLAPPFGAVTIRLYIKQILHFPNRETGCAKSPQKFQLSRNRVQSRFTSTVRSYWLPYKYWPANRFQITSHWVRNGQSTIRVYRLLHLGIVSRMKIFSNVKWKKKIQRK